MFDAILYCQLFIEFPSIHSKVLAFKHSIRSGYLNIFSLNILDFKKVQLNFTPNKYVTDNNIKQLNNITFLNLYCNNTITDAGIKDYKNK